MNRTTLLGFALSVIAPLFSAEVTVLKITSDAPARVAVTQPGKDGAARERAPIEVNVSHGEYSMPLGQIEFVFESDPSQTYTVSLFQVFGVWHEPTLNLNLGSPNFGKAPKRAEAIKAVLADLETRLIDPTAPLFKWGDIDKTYTVSEDRQRIQYRWVLHFLLNSKNRFGGYAGWTECQAYFEDGVLVSVQL